MKQILLIAVVFFLVAGCIDMNLDLSNTINTETARKVAYESLSDDEKASLTLDWKNTSVVIGYYKYTDCGHSFISNSNELKCFSTINSDIKFKNLQHLGAVVFQTKDDALLGPIIVIVDSQSNTVVGFVVRN